MGNYLIPEGWCLQFFTSAMGTLAGIRDAQDACVTLRNADLHNFTVKGAALVWLLSQAHTLRNMP